MHAEGVIGLRVLLLRARCVVVACHRMMKPRMKLMCIVRSRRKMPSPHARS
jgi:hypothetical protein